jgi:hypothetical protein
MRSALAVPIASPLESLRYSIFRGERVVGIQIYKAVVASCTRRVVKAPDASSSVYIAYHPPPSIVPNSGICRKWLLSGRSTAETCDMRLRGDPENPLDEQ